MAENRNDRFSWKAGDIVWTKKPKAVKTQAKKTTKKGKK